MAYFVSSLFSVVISVGMFITTLLLALPVDPPPFGQSAKETGDTLHLCFLCNPVYIIANGLYRIIINHLVRDMCEQLFLESPHTHCKEVLGLMYSDNMVSWDNGIGKHLVFGVIDCLLWLALLFIIEWKLRRQIFRCGHIPPADNVEDLDVANERHRIEGRQPIGSLANEEQLVVRRLSKSYVGDLPTSCRSVTAVQNLSFSIPAGECFGLLGVNGAGKTSTFRMLTGGISMTAGDAWIDGLLLRSRLHEVRRRIGYCPQYDGLLRTLTGREMLTLYARFRGIKRDYLKLEVWRLIEELGLQNYADRLCGSYSGGNKRKLSTALALIGSPSIIFLDEPTTGMDPEARRFLWQVLERTIRSGKSIMLTSHSMEECEALCSRLAIMKGGAFRCIGTPQHLKSRFGKGYTVIVKVDGADETAAASCKSVMKTELPDSILVSEYNFELTFSVCFEL